MTARGREYTLDGSKPVGTFDGGIKMCIRDRRERLLCAVMQNNRLAPSLLQLAPQSETEAFHRCVAVE